MSSPNVPKYTRHADKWLTPENVIGALGLVATFACRKLRMVDGDLLFAAMLVLFAGIMFTDRVKKIMDAATRLRAGKPSDE